jgi:hypothetical protein
MEDQTLHNFAAMRNGNSPQAMRVACASSARMSSARSADWSICLLPSHLSKNLSLIDFSLRDGEGESRTRNPVLLTETCAGQALEVVQLPCTDGLGHLSRDAACGRGSLRNGRGKGGRARRRVGALRLCRCVVHCRESGGGEIGRSGNATCDRGLRLHRLVATN